jgi:hypothetical protein
MWLVPVFLLRLSLALLLLVVVSLLALQLYSAFDPELNMS